MFRAVATRPIFARTALLQPSRAFAYTPIVKNNVIDTAKDILNKANKKTGEVLASAMETAESVTPTVDGVKQAASKVNHKTGEVLADGMEKVEEVANKAKHATEDVAHKAKHTSAEDIKEAASDAASKVNKKTGEALSEGMDKAEQAKDKVKETAAQAEAKMKVEKNAAGYQNLQDKGRKVESEQNRPDDAV